MKGSRCIRNAAAVIIIIPVIYLGHHDNLTESPCLSASTVDEPVAARHGPAKPAL